MHRKSLTKRSNLIRNIAALFFGSGLLTTSSVLQAQSGTWNNTAGGTLDWDDSANWSATTIADGADSTASFTANILADLTVNLNLPKTIGNITFTDTTSNNNNMVISGANTLTLERTDATKPTINVTQSGRLLTISSVIAGNDGLLKSGAGTLVFNAGSNNTFTGGFDISGGTVQYDSATNANAWGDAANVITFTGNATLHNNNNAYTLARAVTVNSGVTASLSGAFGESTNITGAVNGAGDINIAGGSNGWAVTMSNTANNLSGTVWVSSNGGQNTTLTVNSLADGADSTKHLKMGATTAAADFTLQGSTATPIVWTNRAVELAGTTGAISINNNSTSAARSLTISPNLLFTAVASGNKTLTLGGTNVGANAFDGSIGNNGSSTTAITKAGAGTWILSNASNSYTGATNVTGGTLRFASGALGSVGAINASGGTLLWHGGNTQDISGRLAFTAAATSTFNTNGNSVTFASAIGSSSTGNFVKTGLGTLTLQGTNTFTSGTKQLNGGGTLVLDYTTNDNRKLSTGALTLAGGTIVLKGGTTTAETASSTIFNTNTAGTFFVRDGGTAKINLNAFTVGNQSTVSFSHENMATTDRLNVAGIMGAWFTAGNRWATNAGGVGGAGAADSDIVGYTGGTTFTPGAGTNFDVNYDLAGGATLTGTRQLNTLRIESTGDNQVLNLGANSLQTSNLTGTNALAGTSGGLLYAGGANGNYTITDNGSTGRVIIENGNGQAQLINVYTGTLTVNAIVGAGTSAFVKSGEGTLVFNKANGYSGATRVYQGVLRITGAGTLTAGTTVQNGSAIELGNSVAIDGTATLNITGTGVSNGGALRSVATTTSSYAGAITIGTGGARINSDSGLLTLTGGIVTAGQTVTFGGAGNTTVSTAAIAGTGGLVKDGAGTTTLTADNTYGGTTTVNAGTLRINGNQSTATGAVTVASTATLGGSGTIGGAVTVQSGGFLAPGNSAGTQNYNAGLTFDGGSNYNWEHTAGNALGSGGSDYDVANITGGTLVNSGGNLNLNFATGTNFSDSFWDGSPTWNIVTGGSSGATPFGASNIFVTVNGANVDGNNNNIIDSQGFFSTDVSGNDLRLVWNASLGGSPTLSVTPPTVDFGGLLQNATLPAGITVTINNSGAAASGASTVNITGPGASKFTASALPNNLPSGNTNSTIDLAAGATAANGTFTADVEYSVPSMTNPLSASTVDASVTVGDASFHGSMDTSTNFGPALITTVNAGQVLTNVNLASNSDNATVSMGAPAPKVGTTATIVNYDNTLGGAETVGMAWRSRTAAEADLVNNPKALLSDVVRITGMGASETDVGTFLLTMTYDLDLPEFASLNEMAIANSGELQLAWYDPDLNEWVNAIDGNIGGSPDFVGISAPTGGLGSWGIHVDGNGGAGNGKGYVWAYLNHNSDFAVIPEPSTLVLGGLALLGFAGAGLRRRRLAKQSA